MAGIADLVRPGALPAKHLPGTDGAREVPTQGFRLGSRLIPHVIATNDVGLLAGPAGTGKTYTIVTACESIGVPVVFVGPSVSQRVRAIQTGLLDALGISYASNAPSSELDRLLIATLAATPRVIVVDEAARLGRDGLEELRYLHCQPSAAWSLFLVGSGLEEMLRRNAALDSRIARRVLFRHLSQNQSVAFARRFHPLYEKASNDVLARIERHAQGNLRIWARTLEALLTELGPDANPASLNSRVVGAALGATRGLES